VEPYTVVPYDTLTVFNIARGMSDGTVAEPLGEKMVRELLRRFDSQVGPYLAKHAAFAEYLAQRA